MYWLVLKKVIRSVAIEMMRTYKEDARNKAAALTLGISSLRSARMGGDSESLETGWSGPGSAEGAGRRLFCADPVFEKARQHVRS